MHDLEGSSGGSGDELFRTDFDRSGRELTVYLAGELDQATVGGLVERVVGQIRPDDTTVWLDVSSLTFCGSCGIVAFASIANHAATIGATMTIYEPSRMLLRTLEICGLNGHFNMWSRPALPGSTDRQ